MTLYKLTQNERSGPDTFNACVVAARTLEDAMRIHPHGGSMQACEDNMTWASALENVHAEYIGVAAKGVPRGVILASYNAG